MSEESAPPQAQASTGAVEIKLHGRTDVGLIREHNEDSFVIVRLDDGAREPD